MGMPKHPRKETVEDNLLIGLIQREAEIDIRETTHGTFNAIRRVVRSEFGKQWHVVPTLTLQMHLSRPLKGQIIRLMQKEKKK